MVDVDRTRRGACTDEYIEAIQALWSDDETPSYHGEFVSFPPVYSGPKPARKGGPALSIGGHTEATLVRVARDADGLAPGSVTPEQSTALIADFRKRAEALGRDPSGIGILVRSLWPR